MDHLSNYKKTTQTKNSRLKSIRPLQTVKKINFISILNLLINEEKTRVITNQSIRSTSHHFSRHARLYTSISGRLILMISIRQLKPFRAQMRGVRNVEFFLYGLIQIYA